MLLAGSLLLAVASGFELRRDGVPVQFPPKDQLKAELQRLGSSYPFKLFNQSYVNHALATPVDWVAKGAVTPAKDQGPHGYCGTFGRVGAVEGQYVLRGGFPATQFSEEELVDCIGWDRDQFSYFAPNGFMTSLDYPYNLSSYPDSDPPIPGNPCRFEKSKVVKGTSGGVFTDSTGGAPNEDQMAAFVYRNGPLQTGINANVFGLREKNCEATKSCFITAAMCNSVPRQIDHSILIVGYGTDPVHGDYWQVKNSWSTRFANDGFIKVARGINCGDINCAFCSRIPPSPLSLVQVSCLSFSHPSLPLHLSPPFFFRLWQCLYIWKRLVLLRVRERETEIYS
jgi:hypothetical protein